MLHFILCISAALLFPTTCCTALAVLHAAWRAVQPCYTQSCVAAKCSTLLSVSLTLTASLRKDPSVCWLQFQPSNMQRNLLQLCNYERVPVVSSHGGCQYTCECVWLCAVLAEERLLCKSQGLGCGWHCITTFTVAACRMRHAASCPAQAVRQPALLIRSL